MLKYIKLYYHFSLQNIKAKLEYRVDFIIGIVSTILIQVTGIVFIGIVFSRISDIQGWTLYEVALIYGLAGAARGLNEIFFDSVWYISWLYIREGRLDHLLHRPVHILFHIVSDRIETHGLGNLMIGFIIISVSWNKLGIPVSFNKIFLLSLFLASGALIHFAINLFFASIAFWLIDMRHLVFTVDQFSVLGKYPAVIYSKFFQVIITWIFPYAFVGFFPATYMIGRSGYHVMGLLSPVITIIFLTVSVKFFHFALSYYESTGT